MSNSTLPYTLRRIWWHLTPRRRRHFYVLFLVMILASFAEVISIGAVLPFLGALTSPEQIFNHPLAQPFIHALSLTEPEQLLLPLTIVFALGAVGSGLMRFILLWFQTRLGYAIGADFSFKIYHHTLHQTYAVHAARNSSEVISGISNKANSIVGDAILPFASIVSSIIMLISILIALLFIDPVVAMSAFAGFAAIYFVIMVIVRKALARDSQLINYETTRVIKALQEGLGGIRDVLLDGTQAVYCKIYRNADLPLRRAQANVSVISGSPRYGIEALGMVLIAMLAYSLAGQADGFAGALPVLGAMALGAQRLLPVLQLNYASWAKMLGGKEVSNEVLDLLDQPLPVYADAPPQTLMPFQRSITLSDLTFQYDKNAPWVLRDSLNLSIQKGSRIGFIGATGSGKSTLLDIIMGLLQPTGGSIAVDGVNVTEQNFRGWQGHIAHVPQAIFLADISIAENIAFGVPAEEIDYARVYQAAQKAQIAGAIESWSKQYNTLVGERGVRLSGGQRQRIGIARALYKEADVIVFDEATSALDNDTERAVMEAIEDLGDELTVIIVAHRLTTLKNCSQIVELQDGKIKRMGSYTDIVDQSA
ncbi:ABC transporter ATP-binding protein/permease [Porticoccaceae bacterium]|nr:ABC transporter ATP-binding protein/permease [Porticoccaceae bacterium]